MAVEAEIPVFVREFEIQTVEEFGIRALAGNISVRVGYAAVAVPVHECVLYRIALGIIDLLERSVRIRGIAYLVYAEHASGTLADAADLDGIVRIIGIVQFCEFRILEGTCALPSTGHLRQWQSPCFQCDNQCIRDFHWDTERESDACH